MRKRIRLITSLACGVLAALFAFLYAEQARAEVRAERSEVLERYGGEVATLVVAKRELASGEVLSESLLEERDWLSDLAPEGAITNISEIIGLRLTSAVAAGEPLNELDVASQEATIDIPKGRVAISVAVSEKTGLVQEAGVGSRVLVYRYQDDGMHPICSDALILTTSQKSSASLLSSNNTICLGVLPAYAEEVLAASSDGSLRLALPGEGVESTSEAAPSNVDAEEDGLGSETGESDSESEAQESANGSGADEATGSSSEENLDTQELQDEANQTTPETLDGEDAADE